MKNLNRVSPHKDKFGSSIYENDYCRSWIIDECDQKNKGNWLLEKIRLYNNDWYLTDASGAYLIEGTIKESNFSLNLSIYPVGVYYFVIQTESEKKLTPIIKQ